MRLRFLLRFYLLLRVRFEVLLGVILEVVLHFGVNQRSKKDAFVIAETIRREMYAHA